MEEEEAIYLARPGRSFSRDLWHISVRYPRLRFTNKTTIFIQENYESLAHSDKQDLVDTWTDDRKNKSKNKRSVLRAHLFPYSTP